MDFNLETFVEQYTTAIKADDSAEQTKLRESLTSDEQRKEALSAIIVAIKGDEDLLAKAGTTLDMLESVQKDNVAAETVEEDTAAPVEA